MKKKANIFSIISLIIAILSTAMFWLLLGEVTKTVYYPWVILGSISILFPTLAKYFRKASDEGGRTLEIIALVLGFYNFYWVLAVGTQINTFIIFIICSLLCVLYAKSFN